jgi:hypothetical protein
MHAADGDEQHLGLERYLGTFVVFARNLYALFDFSILSSLRPVSTLMPCFLNERASSLDSPHPRAGRFSSNFDDRRVTAKLAYTLANSTPTAPEPMTIRDLGTLRVPGYGLN